MKCQSSSSNFSQPGKNKSPTETPNVVVVFSDWETAHYMCTPQYIVTCTGGRTWRLTIYLLKSSEVVLVQSTWQIIEVARDRTHTLPRLFCPKYTKPTFRLWKGINRITPSYIYAYIYTHLYTHTVEVCTHTRTQLDTTWITYQKAPTPEFLDDQASWL